MKKNMIEITGVDLIKLAQAAYDLSKPQGLGFLHFKEGGLTNQEAKNLINEGSKIPLSMDYVNGRACKLTVFEDNEKLFIADKWFDHSEDDLYELLNKIDL